MTTIIRGSELGVAGCDFVAEGETPGDAVEKMVEHLESEHDIDMPEPSIIMEDSTAMEDIEDRKLDEFLGDDVRHADEGAMIIVKRMRELLNFEDPGKVDPAQRLGDSEAYPHTTQR